MPIESKLIEVILAIGLSVIAYFLKLIHSDLRSLILQVQTQSTQIAVINKELDTLSKRMDKVENEVNHE